MEESDGYGSGLILPGIKLGKKFREYKFGTFEREKPTGKGADRKEGEKTRKIGTHLSSESYAK